MGGTYKPRHVVLQEFTTTLHALDPVGLAKQGAPNDEYETEALSLLCRFHEAMFREHSSEEKVFDLASSIVRQTFGFWFGETTLLSDQVTAVIARALLTVYNDSYPSTEKTTGSGVV